MTLVRSVLLECKEKARCQGAEEWMGEGVESEHGVLLALRVKSGCEGRRKLST